MRRPALSLLLAVAGCVIVLDRITKFWAESALDPMLPRPLIGSFLQLHLTYNSGAAFSLGSGSTWLFSIISTGVSIWIIRVGRRLVDLGWAVGLGGVLGGAVGNLIDRLTNAPGFGRGLVVDFLELPYWPVFNVADSAVFCSAILLIWFSLRGRDGGVIK